MTDPTMLFRISALERAIASLGEGNSLAPYGQEATPSMPSPNARQSEPDERQDARITALESSVLALSNSVNLLNMQMSTLSSAMHEQMTSLPIINVPAGNMDEAQDRRLDDLDTLVKTLTHNVADYNKQMVELISAYKKLNPQAINPGGHNPGSHGTSGTRNGTPTASSNSGWG